MSKESIEIITNNINNLRLKNKNNWYYSSITTEKGIIQIKGYNTYLQVFNINNVRYGVSCEFPTVKAFKDYIKESLKSI